MSSVRDDILAATGRVLSQSGLSGTTIDAVAAAAGMTKGGVLYYFPSKQRLILGSMKCFEDIIAQKREEHHAAHPDDSPVRTYIMSLLSFYRETAGAHSAIGLMGEPAYREALCKMKSDIYRGLMPTVRTQSGLAAVMLTLDGVWINSLFQCDAITPEMHARTLDLLLEWVDELDRDDGVFSRSPVFATRQRAVVPHPKARDSFRDRVLAAAGRVLNRDGLAKTTYEAVAREAGMSKGGIFHHYASRNELLAAVLQWYEEQYYETREKVLAALPPSPSRLARATIVTIMERRKLALDPTHYRVDMLDDPGFRRIIGETKSAACRDVLAGARQPHKALAAVYIMDGLWMDSLFSESPYQEGVATETLRWLDGYLEELFEDYGD